MSFLLDQCVPRKYLGLLHSWGYPATLLHEHLSPDAPDVDVIALAQTLDAILLTVDLDFANIVQYPPGDYAGIVVLRYEASSEALLENTLHEALTDLYRDPLRGVLVIIEPTRYRIRRP
jgi:predicted nuclease of predicted toxin-antitoxin system